MTNKEYSIIKTANLMREKEQYINGFKKLQERGVYITIEGKKPGDEEWNNLLTVKDDGSFYMGDFVNDEEGKLQEIHFDLVKPDSLQKDQRRTPPYYGRRRKDY